MGLWLMSAVVILGAVALAITYHPAVGEATPWAVQALQVAGVVGVFLLATIALGIGAGLTVERVTRDEPAATPGEPDTELSSQEAQKNG